jgi:hypothetical protein
MEDVMNLDPALQDLLIGLLGAALAYGWVVLLSYLKGRPDFYEIQEVFTALAVAASANKKLTNAERLQYVIDLGTKYLKARGLLNMFDPAALAEAGHDFEKTRALERAKNFPNVAKYE